MAARTIACTIDAGMENPGERPFEVDLHEYCRQHRAELLRACLIVLRAFACASDREETIKRLTPMGGFESWTATVRGAISWVGELDPCTSMAALREDNPESVLLGNLMLAWRDCPTLGLQDPKKGAEHGWHTCSDVVGQKEKSTGRGLKLAMERIWEPPKRTVTVDGLGRYLSGMLRKVIRIGDQDLRFERRQNALTRRAMYALVVVPSQDDFAFGGDDQDPGPPATE